MYRHEQEKPTSRRGLLRTHRDDITELHEPARSRMIEVGHEDLDDVVQGGQREAPDLTRTVIFGLVALSLFCGFSGM